MIHDFGIPSKAIDATLKTLCDESAQANISTPNSRSSNWTSPHLRNSSKYANFSSGLQDQLGDRPMFCCIALDQVPLALASPSEPFETAYRKVREDHRDKVPGFYGRNQK